MTTGKPLQKAMFEEMNQIFDIYAHDWVKLDKIIESDLTIVSWEILMLFDDNLSALLFQFGAIE